MRNPDTENTESANRTDPGHRTESGTTGWNTETLLNHLTSRMDSNVRLLEALIKENQKRNDQRFEMMDKEILLASEGQKISIDAALSAQEKSLNLALVSADKAVSKAELANEKRFEGVNEFRATLSDQQRNLIPRAEAEVKFQAIDARLSDMVDRVNREEGKQSGSKDAWGWVFGGVMLIVSLLTAAATMFAHSGRI